MRAHTNKERIESLMRELGAAALTEGTVFFTGGVSAVLLGWREQTIDVDLKADPEPRGFFECLPGLKDRLDINIELASPDLFVPALPGWRERSPFIVRHGRVDFHHYDFYGQALAKLERDHPRDRFDVGCMVREGQVEPLRLVELFDRVEGDLIRFPAVDAALLRERVLDLASGLG